MQPLERVMSKFALVKRFASCALVSLLAAVPLASTKPVRAQSPPILAIRARPGDTTFPGGGMLDHKPLTGDAGMAFDIRVVFGTGLTSQQQTFFSIAESFWESKITGYQPGINVSSVTITVSSTEIDGQGSILGQSGPTSVTNQGGYSLARQGVMKFDSADLENLDTSGSLLDVVTHEMGHVLGIGTLWDFGLNNVYKNGSGEYTGAAGLARWKTEYNQPDATFIPIELNGGEGTKDGHWNEQDNGKDLTGITDSLGRDMRNELMTGWLDTPTHLADFTLQSLVDIGYQVVPEPGTGSLSGMAVLALIASRFRWRRRS